MDPIMDFIISKKRNIEKTEKPPNPITYIFHGYDEETNAGIMFQKEPIKKEYLEEMEKTYDLDWIFNVQDKYVRFVEIGKYVACEVAPEWEEAIQVAKQNVFLFTNTNEWIWLVERTTFTLEIESVRKKVWIGELCRFQDVLENTCLSRVLKKAGKAHYRELEPQSSNLQKITIAYARCEASMMYLDTVHRDYINKHTFEKNTVTAIQSVAGSGKTTTLLNLAKIHSTKRILYIAFNKSLITEIKDKVRATGIKNMFPYTFDSLLYHTYSFHMKKDPNILQLRPQTMVDFLPWLQGKPYNVKKDIIRKFNNFCNCADFLDMQDYCIQVLGKKRPLMEQLWAKAKAGEFHTFESLRKLALIDHWFDPYIDKTYDMIMIDETQDFDMSMLQMLLKDTTIPKLFVGDPKQSIYEFRGCINAFHYMPSDALKIEFYSTFRIGNPACQIIRKQFSNCWMISKSTRTTVLEPFSKWTPESSDIYTYLFRGWKGLLTTASKMKDVWINSYEKKVEEIRSLHKKLAYTFSLEDEFEDDLPKFLKSISSYELDSLFQSIENNIVDKDKAKVKMYTVHSYKGLEDEIVRLAEDIDREEETIYYVALTRGYTRTLTPIDVEYFEKLGMIKMIDTTKSNPDPSINNNPFVIVPTIPTIPNITCTCGGCQCANPTLFQFDTTMGKRMWCMQCQRYGCSC